MSLPKTVAPASTKWVKLSKPLRISSCVSFRTNSVNCSAKYLIRLANRSIIYGSLSFSRMASNILAIAAPAPLSKICLTKSTHTLVNRFMLADTLSEAFFAESPNVVISASPNIGRNFSEITMPLRIAASSVSGMVFRALAAICSTPGSFSPSCRRSSSMETTPLLAICVIA